jgi:hypothetical protein
MGFRSNAKPSNDLDGLRLLALSRIPRCGSCPRFGSLVEAYAGDERPMRQLGSVPANCTHQVCAPLAERYRPPEAAPRSGARVASFSPAIRTGAGFSSR